MGRIETNAFHSVHATLSSKDSDIFIEIAIKKFVMAY